MFEWLEFLNPFRVFSRHQNRSVSEHIAIGVSESVGASVLGTVGVSIGSALGGEVGEVVGESLGTTAGANILGEMADKSVSENSWVKRSVKSSKIAQRTI